MKVMAIEGLKILGAAFIEAIGLVGDIAIFFLHAFLSIFMAPFYPSQTIKSVVDIGLHSVTIIAISSFFMGSVFVMQTYIGLSRFNAVGALAEASVVSITREIGPLLVGLILSGRVGASISAELSTMQVTEQIDALRTLNTPPMRYLVAPRLIAAILVFPILGIVSDVVGVYGGYLVAITKLSSTPHMYISNTISSMTSYDVITGLIKTSCFGAVIVLSGCYSGFRANRGAQGVGDSVTQSVILSSSLVLLSNYVLTSIFFGSSNA